MDATELLKTEARLLAGYCLLILKIQGICLSINIYYKYGWCYRLNHLENCKGLCKKSFLASLWYSRWMAEPAGSSLVEGSYDVACVWLGYISEMNIRKLALYCLFPSLRFTMKWWSTFGLMLPPWGITKSQIPKLLTTQSENTDILTKINPCSCTLFILNDLSQ